MHSLFSFTVPLIAAIGARAVPDVASQRNSQSSTQSGNSSGAANPLANAPAPNTTYGVNGQLLSMLNPFMWLYPPDAAADPGTDANPAAGDQSVVDHIRNTIALYAYIEDAKKFDQYPDIFTQNVSVIYPSGIGRVDGIEAVKAGQGGRLGKPFLTQHHQSNSKIDVLSPNSAYAVTYYHATIFDADYTSLKKVEIYGHFYDNLTTAEDGAWKICFRNATTLVSYFPSARVPRWLISVASLWRFRRL